MPPRRPRSSSKPLKAFAAPAMAAVSLLIMVPGVWAALLLAGIPVPNAGRDDARTMAVAMLIAWPIALLLLAMAAYVWWSGRRR